MFGHWIFFSNLFNWDNALQKNVFRIVFDRYLWFVHLASTQSFILTTLYKIITKVSVLKLQLFVCEPHQPFAGISGWVECLSIETTCDTFRTHWGMSTCWLLHSKSINCTFWFVCCWVFKLILGSAFYFSAFTLLFYVIHSEHVNQVQNFLDPKQTRLLWRTLLSIK